MKLRNGLALAIFLLALSAVVVSQTIPPANSEMPGRKRGRGKMPGGMPGGMMGEMMGRKGPLPGSGDQGFPNPNGHSATISLRGAMAGPFSMIFSPTNGRNCATCHQGGEGMSVSAAGLQARFDQSDGTDPIFRTNDGSNCDHGPNNSALDVSTVAARREAYGLLRTRGLIRVALSFPAGSEVEVASAANPYGCSETEVISMYRRPLPSANLRFLTSVMWDSRESSTQTGTVPIDSANYPKSLSTDLSHQALDAATGHAQAPQVPNMFRMHAVDYEMDLITAQASTVQAGRLDAAGARGGAAALAEQAFSVGINDPQGSHFNPAIFDLYDAWSKLPETDPRAAIARGQSVFNTKTFTITGVAGLNDSFKAPSLQGHCGTCHNTPNVGNHSVAMSANIGTADPANPQSPVPVDYLPLFNLRNAKTGQTVQTTDPGLAVITGKFADIGKVKIPVLRGLASRAPYLHNGSAMTISDVVNFHNSRFKIGLTPKEKADLTAFLGAL